jgi:uncharacterized iron-regulated protein
MKFLLFLMLIMSVSVLAQTSISEVNYRVFDAQGSPATIEQIIVKINKADVLFLGEQHDDMVAHTLQMQIFKAVFEKYGIDKKVTLSMEMFERDVQIVLDEYLKNYISESHFISSSRPWGNYKTDYRPLIEFAKQNKINVVAANAPRRYVNMVSRLGKDSVNQLSADSKKWLAPLPLGESSDAYAQKFNALMGQTSDSVNKHNSMLASQTLWDATMAYSVYEYLKQNKNALVVHLNGSFHTENRLGTVEQLLKYKSDARILVVTMKYDENFTTFDKTKYENLGDFVILTDAKIPRSSK